MVKHNRKPTPIVVKVLDTSELEAKAYEALKQAGNTEYTRVSTLPLAIVTTLRGTFAFDDEGVGNIGPITKEKPHTICFWGRNESAMSAAPVFSMPLDDSALLMVPIKETVNLAAYIRVFGARLDRNYEEWRAFLEPLIA